MSIPGMIDIHSHILPGVDDGAEDMEDAVAIGRLAASDGTRTILATSHSAEWFELGPLSLMQERVAELQTALDKAGVALKVLPAMEIFLTPDTPKHLASGRAWTLAGSRYVLVELPYDIWPNYTEQTLFELQVAGYMPILAHPERCSAIQQDLAVMQRLAERGVLGQVTSLALAGKQGGTYKSCAQALLTQRLVQFIASDGHDIGHRFGRLPTMSAGVAVAAALIGAEAAHAMVTTNPQAVLDNAVLTPDPLPLPEKKGLLSRFFGG